jgi:hypothetical protein
VVHFCRHRKAAIMLYRGLYTLLLSITALFREPKAHEDFQLDRGLQGRDRRLQQPKGHNTKAQLDMTKDTTSILR